MMKPMPPPNRLVKERNHGAVAQGVVVGLTIWVAATGLGALVLAVLALI
jgi:hypothetical protein